MIGIIGGGNIGTELAGELTHRGFDVCLYAKDISIFSSGVIQVNDHDKNISYQAKIRMITSSLFDAVSNSEVIIITYPSNAFKYIYAEFIEAIKRLNTAKKVIFLPGIGGVEYLFKELISYKTTIIGLQRVPAVYRVKEKGKIAEISGRRKEGLFAASIPTMNKTELKDLVSKIFDLKCEIVPNYLSITLTPSNPILHTSRLYNLFKDRDKDFLYDRNPLFYGEWDIPSSISLIKCDKELGLIKERLQKYIDVSFVESLIDHYESSNEVELTNKISSIQSLHDLESPMIKENDKYRIDWSSRYFQADFPNGLVIIKAIALLVDVKTPMIDEIIFWFQEQVKKEYLLDEKTLGSDAKECYIPQNYGIKDFKDLISYYLN